MTYALNYSSGIIKITIAQNIIKTLIALKTKNPLLRSGFFVPRH